MRTVAQLRRDQGVGAPVNVDSLYKDIERAPRKFNPLKIPKSLQAALPFKTKPKLEPARKHKTLEQRRAVVLEPEEKKLVSLVQQLNAIRCGDVSFPSCCSICPLILRPLLERPSSKG